MERSSRREERASTRPSWRSRAGNTLKVLGISTLIAGGGLAVAGYMNQDEPVSTTGPAREKPRASDGQVRVATFNVARDGVNQLPNIGLLMQRERLDALMLQEVTTTDSRQIQQALKAASLFVSYKLADGRQKPQEKGLGDMIITPTRQYDTHARIIKGGSSAEVLTKTVAGAVSDISRGVGNSIVTLSPPSINLNDASQGLLENREVLFAKTKVDGGPEIQLMTTHIASIPSGVHREQLETVLDYAGNAAKQDIPVVLCGDFNQEPRQMVAGMGQLVPAFGDRGFLTGSTNGVSTIGKPGNPASRIDYCFVHSAGQLGAPISWVVQGPRSDHRPVATAMPLLPVQAAPID